MREKLKKNCRITGELLVLLCDEGVGGALDAGATGAADPGGGGGKGETAMMPINQMTNEPDSIYIKIQSPVCVFSQSWYLSISKRFFSSKRTFLLWLCGCKY